MKEVCKYCGEVLDAYEDKICEFCLERIEEDKAERERERVPTETEEIFGSEEAYYRYRNG